MMKSSCQILTYVCLLLMTSCSSGQNKEKKVEENDDFHFGDKMEEAVVGVWKNNAMDVQVNSFNNTDTSFQVSVTEGSWKIMMDIKPIMTQIKSDGTFFTEYRDLRDQVIKTNQGVWFLDGDSLFMEDKKGYKFSYKILIKDNEMELQTLVDYDDDGKKDDFYFGKYVRVE